MNVARSPNAIDPDAGESGEPPGPAAAPRRIRYRDIVSAQRGIRCNRNVEAQLRIGAIDRRRSHCDARPEIHLRARGQASTGQRDTRDRLPQVATVW